MERDEPIEAPEKLEDPDLLYHQIKECLSYHDARGLTTYILERNFSDQTIFFDVASDIVRCLTQANLEENPGFFQTCERCLKYLVRTGKPRLLLLAMLENWGDLVDDTQFKSVLGPISDCLLAFPKPCQSSLESSVQAVYNYISRLELPDDNVLDGEERQLLDSDPVVIRLMDVSLAMLNFLEPFVKAVSIKEENNKRRSMPHQATILSKYLLLLLNRPLIYMDLVPPDADKKMKAKSESRISAETVMSYLGMLNVNFFQLVEEIIATNMNQEEKKRKKKEKKKKQGVLDDEQNSKEENDNISNEKVEKEGKDNTEPNKKVLDDEEEEEEDDDDDELNVPDLSISCLLYLVFTEHLSVDNVPWVYSPQHILEFCLPYVIHLLNRTEFMILFKGVHLLDDCLQRLEASTLSASYLENDIYIQLLNKLTRVMLHCPVADLRQLSVKVFTNMIKKFQSAGRCRAYECLLVTCDNPGVLGYCIQLLKEEINVCLQCDPVTDQTFLGKRLHKLLRIILHLPEAETTDILQHSDRIISAMNFVRYLALRDPPHRNVTGFWNLLSEVEEKFLSQMQIAVDMSRAHYKLELNNIKSRQKSKKKQADDDGDNEPEVTVSIGSQLAPGMPPEEQAKVLNNALNTFDIMESLLCRIREILQQQQPSCS